MSALAVVRYSPHYDLVYKILRQIDRPHPVLVWVVPRNLTERDLLNFG